MEGFTAMHCDFLPPLNCSMTHAIVRRTLGPLVAVVALGGLAVSQNAISAQMTPRTSRGPDTSSLGPAVIDGFVMTTHNDPEWVVAVSTAILRRDLCVASPPCDAALWYERVDQTPCYNDTMFYKLDVGFTSASAFPLSGLLPGPEGIDGLYVRGPHTAQLFDGVDLNAPLTGPLTGETFFSLTLWDGLACDGFEPGTVLMSAFVPGALNTMSLTLGPPPATDLNCEEFDRYEDLTPNDTLTVIASEHNPEQAEGYLYMAAVNASNEPIGFDHLIGSSLVIDGFTALEYSINAVDYRAGVGEGVKTDIDMDENIDLNGMEYERTAGEILIPRFVGFTPDESGELLLIALSGGRKFQTTVDFLIYNDNEQEFSAEYSFRCWDRAPLSAISGVFESAYLGQHTGNDSGEDLNGLEYGWMRITGGEASSSARSIMDPAVYAVYVERLQLTAAATLPFERCLRTGHLLPDGVMGDNEEAAYSRPDCTSSNGRRLTGSFLLYPEFDSRPGAISVMTVTNTNPTVGTRVHCTYIGRYGI